MERRTGAGAIKWKQKRWDKYEIVTKPSDGICVRAVMRVNRVQKSVTVPIRKFGMRAAFWTVANLFPTKTSTPSFRTAFPFIGIFTRNISRRETEVQLHRRSFKDSELWWR